MSFISVYHRIFNSKKIDYEKLLCEAYESQMNENYDNALELYEKLYCHYKRKKLHFKLAQVINNMIVIMNKTGKDAKELYQELSGLRFRQFFRNEERFGMDYVYTLIMGVEWFDLPAEKTLAEARKILNIYKTQPFYPEIMKKIEELEIKAQEYFEYQTRLSA